MPTNSLKSKLIDWSTFKDTTNDNVVSLDINAIQSRLDARSLDPRRWHTGTFRCPKDARPEQYQRIKYEAIQRWVRAMEGMGWVLRSRIAVFPSKYEAHEPGSNKVQVGLVEYQARALFEKEHAKRVRTEIDPRILEPVVLR
jgi:hypothetical protein